MALKTVETCRKAEKQKRDFILSSKCTAGRENTGREGQTDCSYSKLAVFGSQNSVSFPVNKGPDFQGRCKSILQLFFFFLIASLNSNLPFPVNLPAGRER